MVASADERFGPLLQRYGDKGFDRLGKSGLFDAFATNYRMSEPQAAVAAAQLSRLEAIAAKRAHFGNLLTEKIAGVPGIEPHQVHVDDRCVYWFYMLRLHPKALRCDRAEFAKALAAEGARVGFVYRGNREAADSLVQEVAATGGASLALQADVTDGEDEDQDRAEHELG